MGVEPKRVHITLSFRQVLAEEAGVAVVTCRHLGNRQQGKIELEMVRRSKEHRQAVGEDWLSGAMASKAIDQEATERRLEERVDKKRREDPEGAALEKWPPDLVCEAIRDYQGASSTGHRLHKRHRDGDRPARVVRCSDVERRIQTASP